MMDCRDCGHKVSQRAAMCPSCGAKEPAGAPGNIIGIIGLIFLLFLFVKCSG